MTRLLTAVILLTQLCSCGIGKNSASEIPAYNGPFLAPIDMNLSQLDDSVIVRGSNSIAILRSRWDTICTASFIGFNKLLINGHCVWGKSGNPADESARANDLWIEWKRDSESKVVQIPIKEILIQKFARTADPSNPNENISVSLIDYAILSFETDLVLPTLPVSNLDFLSGVSENSLQPVSIPVFQSPGFKDVEGDVGRFDLKRGHISFKNLSAEAKRWKDPNSCNDSLDSLIRKGDCVKSSHIPDQNVRIGNSGSPVIIDGKIIGVVHSGGSYERSNGIDYDGGIYFQWISSITPFN